MDFQQITKDDNNMLIHGFDENEIKKAVWECGNNKIPSPNGFNFNFIKKYWNVIDKEIIKVVHNF